MNDTQRVAIGRRTVLALAGSALLAGLVPARALTPIWMGEIIGRTTGDDGVSRFYIRIERSRNDAALIEIARHWHRRYSRSLIWFFDDKAEIDRVIAVRSGLASPRGDYPQAWVKAHTIARIGPRRFARGTRWVLVRGLEVRGEQIAILDAR